MTIKLANRVKESTLTSGTGNVVLAGPISGYQAFSSALSSGEQTFYTIDNTPNWEVGVGTFLGGSVSRDTVLSSSSGGSKISLSGQSYIFIAYPSEKAVRLNSNGAILAENGLYLETGVPASTGNVLYNSGGNLYFNGALLGGAGTSYTAGDGLDLSGTEFSVDDTVARSGDNVSIFSNDSGYVVLPAGGTTGQELYKVADTGVELAWKDDYSAELRETVQNDTAGDITKGTLVMSVGAAGDTIKIAPAVTDGSVEARYILGIATETITAGGGRGQVTFFGPFKGYDTSLYSVGTVLYNDPNNNGQLSSSVPTSPELSMPVAIVTKVGNSSSGRLFVRMWTQQEGLHELHDVAIDAASSGDGIKYTGTTWVPDTDIVHSGDGVSVLNNDAGYVTTDTTYIAGTGLSLDGTQFNIDETVLQSGDNISLLNNDAGYLTSHPSVSAATSSDNSGRTYVQDLFFDQYGHVTGISTATETVVDTDTTYTAGDGLGLTGTEFSVDGTVARSGDNVSQFVNDAGYLTTDNDTTYTAGTGLSLDGTQFNIDETVLQSGDNISLLNNDAGYLTSHPSVSAATSSDNSGRTYVQDLFVDQYGHVTGISTATETVVDTDTTYTAGDGLGLTGTEFSVDGTVARSGDNVSQFVNDAGYLTTDNDTTYTAGTGLSLDGTTFNIDSTVVQFSDITSGSITAGTGNIDFSVANSGDVLTQQGDGSFAMSAPAGGGIGGSTGSTDNAILRADGTGGNTLQSSLAKVDDNGNISVPWGSYVCWGQSSGAGDTGFSVHASGVYTILRTYFSDVVGFSHYGYITIKHSSGYTFSSNDNLAAHPSNGLYRTDGDNIRASVWADRTAPSCGLQATHFEAYNTYTSTTSYERLDISWSANICTIQTTAGSAGGTVRDLSIQNAIKIDGPNESVSELKLKVYTDATRPAAGTAGRMIYNSTDGNLNIDNGTNWILPDGTAT
jgi:hypothetical protein